MTDTLTDYWSSKADEHHANVEKLVARYENATNDNYEDMLRDIATEEALAEYAEAMFERAMKMEAMA